MCVEEAIDYVSNDIRDSFVTVGHSDLKKVTCFMFNKLEEAKNFVKTPTIYNGRPVDFYQTVNYDKDVTIVKIQNFSGVAMSDIIASLSKKLSSIGTITDISCYKPYDMKVLFKKSDPQAEIPNLLEFENIVVPITYKGCKPAKQAKLSTNKINQKKINNFFGITGKYAKDKYLVGTSVEASKTDINLDKNIDALIYSQKPHKLQAENSENKKPPIKLLADFPNTKSLNTYQNNRFDCSFPITPNFKKEWVDKLANNNNIADLEMQYVHKVAENKPHQKLIVLASYNMNIMQVQKFIIKSGLNLTQCQVENSTGSRYNGANMSRMLDHIFYRQVRQRPSYCTLSHTANPLDYPLIKAKWDIESIMKIQKQTLNINDLDFLCNDIVKIITDAYAELKNSRQNIEFPSKILLSKTYMSTKKRRKLFRKTKNNADIIPLYNKLKVIIAKTIKNVVKLKYLKELEAVTGDLIKNNYTFKCTATINNNKSKVQKAMYVAYSFLKSKKMPTVIRLKVLQSVMIPIGTYGADLIKHLYKSRSNTWISDTLGWQKRYNHSIETGDTRISIDARNQLDQLAATVSRANNRFTDDRKNTNKVVLDYRATSKVATYTKESKKSLLQLSKEKKINILPSIKLETAKFMYSIRVARTLILDGIKCSPTPLNRFPVESHTLKQVNSRAPKKYIAAIEAPSKNNYILQKIITQKKLSSKNINKDNLTRRKNDAISESERNYILKENIKTCNGNFENHKNKYAKLFSSLNMTVSMNNSYNLEEYLKVKDIFKQCRINNNEVLECISDMINVYTDSLNSGGESIKSFSKNMDSLINKNSEYRFRMNKIFLVYVDTVFSSDLNYKNKFQNIMRLLNEL
ncbi:hypothetical protein BB561_001332 [Smittium simulii]|uniref:Uncharacterized protein n=1 Tax=Smittium simulii TaxID=133385 RepID=A0A2T9YV44_9FUNG|nr:hypothetical protein BB561_001332 [Smittium simulii]